MPTTESQLPVAERDVLNHSEPGVVVPETGDYEPVSAGTLEAVLGELSRRIVLIEKRIANLDGRGTSARSVLTNAQQRTDLTRQLNASVAELGLHVHDWLAAGHRLVASEGHNTPSALPVATDAEPERKRRSIETRNFVHPPAQLDAARVDELRESLRNALRSATSSAPSGVAATAVAHKRFKELRNRLGKPRENIATLADVLVELGTLEAGAREVTAPASRVLPDKLLHALCSFVVSRARRLQNEVPAAQAMRADIEDRVHAIFRPVSALARERMFGFVHGMMRDNRPLRGTWNDDTQHWMNEVDRVAGNEFGEPFESGLPTFNSERTIAQLVQVFEEGAEPEVWRPIVANALQRGLRADDPRVIRLLTPHVADLLGTEFRALRRAIAEQSADEASGPEIEREAIPTDWSGWPMVRGKRGVIVGGDARPRAAESIREALELDDLEWIATDGKGMRRVENLVERVRSGSIDVVFLLLNFMSHSVWGKIVDEAKGTSVTVFECDKGYGVTQIRAAVERRIGSTSQG